MLFAIITATLYRIFTESLIFLSPFWKLKSNPGKKGTIVLVNGWLSTQNQMFYLKKELEKAGYSVYIPDFGLQLRDVEHYAGRLNKYINKNRLKNFHLVGYSMGGVIALAYFQNYSPKIKSFTSISAPFSGVSRAKYVFFSKGAKELAKHSPLLEKVRNGKKPKPFYNLSLAYDETVPAASTKIPSSEELKLPINGHTTILFSRKTVEAILRNLN